MAKKFLSFLGTGLYEEGNYYYKNQSNAKVRTRFVQEALVSLFCSEWEKEDEVIVFLTDLARCKNWNNVDDKNRQLKNILDRNKKIRLKDVSIPDCKTEEEIWEIFNIISNNVNENDEVIFDITHSFRSIPMLAMVVLNYLKAAKNVKLSGIYYGCWEGKDQKNNVPIFDLTPFDNMLEWSQAVNTFLKNGVSGPLHELSMKDLNEDCKENKTARRTRSIIEKLHDFSMCIYTCRGSIPNLSDRKARSKKSIGYAFKETTKSIRELEKEESEISLIPFQCLMLKIDNKLERFDSIDVLKSGIASVQWCIDNNLIQQGYTALEETVKTYICKKFSLDCNSRNDREEIAKKALIMKSKPNNKMIKPGSKNFDLVNHIATKLDQDIAQLSRNISERRNDINHFGFNSKPASYTSLVDGLEKNFEEFMEILKRDEDIETAF